MKTVREAPNMMDLYPLTLFISHYSGAVPLLYFDAHFFSFLSSSNRALRLARVDDGSAVAPRGPYTTVGRGWR